MIEDIPDHRRILDETGDPRRPLTFRADQGTTVVLFLFSQVIAVARFVFSSLATSI
jgi:hypothetical protein